MRQTIEEVFDRFTQTGSVADLPRPGRPSTSRTPERLKDVRELVAENPHTSVTAGAVALAM